jgi:hypothetical protein
MEIFNKTEIQKANKALFLEKVQCFVDKGIISIPEKKSCVSGNVRFIFTYKLDTQFKVIQFAEHLHNKGIKVYFNSCDSKYLAVDIPESKEKDSDKKLKYHKITVSYPECIVKQVSSTSFDKALESMNTFLEAIEDFKV